MKQCKPQSCTCQSESGEDNEIEINFDKIKKGTKFFKKKFGKLQKICPGQTPPTTCTCSGEKNETIEAFNDPIDVLDCLPDTCTCQDGSEINVRKTSPFNRFAKICGKLTAQFKFYLEFCCSFVVHFEIRIKSKN